MPFNMEIGQSFIAAILTVIGYSLNDTVVVFDRIREYFNDHPSWKMSKVIDSAFVKELMPDGYSYNKQGAYFIEIQGK